MLTVFSLKKRSVNSELFKVRINSKIDAVVGVS